MDSAVLHRVSGTLEWTLGFAYAFAAASPRALVAQAPAQPPTGGGVDLGNGNTQLVLIGLAVVTIVARIADVVIDKYKIYRTVNSESDHGKLIQCVEGREADAKVARENLMTVKAAWAADVERLKAHQAAVAKDYEDRLESKRIEIDYLRVTIEANREREKQLQDAYEALTASFVQQNEKFAELASRSAENTNAAIRRIPKAPPKPGDSETDGDMATLTAPVGKIDVIVSALGNSGEHPAVPQPAKA